MPFISYCYLVWFLYYSHFKYRCAKIWNKKVRRQKVKEVFKRNCRIRDRNAKFGPVRIRWLYVNVYRCQDDGHKCSCLQENWTAYVRHCISCVTCWMERERSLLKRTFKTLNICFIKRDTATTFMEIFWDMKVEGSSKCHWFSTFGQIKLSTAIKYNAG